MSTERPIIFMPDHSEIQSAAEILRGGGLVAFPTETVYGLGGDATNDSAVAAIFDAKARPTFNPLIVHFHTTDAVWQHVIMNPMAEKLAEAFWPGPLTMVLPRQRQSSLSLLVSSGLDTVAVRVPSGVIAHDLLETTDRPVAAPSANRAGSISPTQAAHVSDSLGNRIDAIIDGGPCRIGIESTVIAFENDRGVLLRPGGITREEIEAVIGSIDVVSNDVGDEPTAPSSPGMLNRHYAPDSPVRLNAASTRPGEVLLGFGPDALNDAPEGSLNLSETGDIREAAANLFGMLRQLDQLNAVSIAVMPIPEKDLGIAINDRLRRAAAPENP